MVSAPGDLAPVSASCDVGGQVGACPMDPVTAGSTALPFDDVLWSSAVLPQTGGLSHVSSSSAPTNGGGSSSAITYLLSGVTPGGSVSLVGQTDSSGQVLFNSGGMGANSGGELSSTLMISHLTSELHSLSGGALVSPTLQPMTTAGQLSADQMPQHHLQQQPAQPAGHQCSDFSVCYLIGGQNHVK